ncbi:MAG: hypothetical protein K940chlam3_01297 [Chlamydiae bacterium]|nr:hypothetical protein [Chlamydiota bacterium]
MEAKPSCVNREIKAYTDSWKNRPIQEKKSKHSGHKVIPTLNLDFSSSPDDHSSEPRIKKSYSVRKFVVELSSRSGKDNKSHSRMQRAPSARQLFERLSPRGTKEKQKWSSSNRHRVYVPTFKNPFRSKSDNEVKTLRGIGKVKRSLSESGNIAVKDKRLVLKTDDSYTYFLNPLWPYNHGLFSLGMRKIHSKKEIFCFKAVTIWESFFLTYARSLQIGECEAFFDRFILVVPKEDKYGAVGQEVIKILTDPVAQNMARMEVWAFIKEHHRAELRQAKGSEEQDSLLRGTSVASEIMKIQFPSLLSNVLEESTKRAMVHLLKITRSFPVVLHEKHIREFHQTLIAKKYHVKTFEKCKGEFFKNNCYALKIALNYLLEDMERLSIDVPKEIKDIYRDHANNCRMLFPESEDVVHQQIAGMFILRVLNAYLISSHEKIKKKFKNFNHRSRFIRAMISFSSLIQWTANEVSSDCGKIPPLVKPLFKGTEYENRKDCLRRIVTQISGQSQEEIS